MVRQAINNDTKLVTIRTRYVRENKGGVIVTVDGENEIFLPWSLIEVQRESSPYCAVDLPEWLAIDRGLENEVVT